MRPLRIEARDFLPYENLDLDLSGSSLVAITGANGSGKSTLLDMVLWSVWGEGRGSADDMIREGQLSCWVRTTWLIGEQTVSIARTRSMQARAGDSSLDLYIDGQRATRHTIAETQAAIRGLIRMAADSVLAGPFMVQGRSDELMRAKPAERTDVLMDIEGLLHFDRYHEEAKSRATQQEQREKQLAATLETENAILADEQEVQDMVLALRSEQRRAAEAVEETTQRVMAKREEAARLAERARRAEELGAQIERIQKDMARVEIAKAGDEAELRESRRLVSTPLPAITIAEPNRGDLATAEEAQEQLSGEAHLLAAEASQHAARLATVQQLREDARHERCEGAPDSCRMAQIADAARGRLAYEEDRLTSAHDAGMKYTEVSYRLAAAETAVRTARMEFDSQTTEHHSQVVAAERAIAAQMNAVNRITKLETQLAEAGAVLGEASTRITQLNAERLRLSQDEFAASHIADELRDLALRIEDERNELARVQASLGSANARLERVEEAHGAVVRLGAQREAAGREAELNRELARLFHRSGLPTMILEASLPIIEERANEVLARMPGGYSIRIVTQRATKTGGTRDTLDVLVLANDLERNYNLLSGGERFRVDFAIRLGLAAAIGRSAGSSVDTLWIDEGWGSQDRDGREAMLEAIGAVADEFSLILVVSHLPEVTDRFPERIVVTKDADSIATAVIAA